MSFGVGVGDFLAILNLARELRQRFVDAPEAFAQIRDECVPSNKAPLLSYIQHNTSLNP